MKLCKAWPEACQDKSSTNSDSEKSIVLTKSIVDRAVDRVVTTTMSDILKDAFGSDDVAEDPIVHEVTKQETKQIPQKIVIDNNKSELTIVWTILAAFGIIVVIALQNMWSRINSMEAWLHGRLATHH
jgi:hypothetical protein